MPSVLLSEVVTKREGERESQTGCPLTLRNKLKKYNKITDINNCLFSYLHSLQYFRKGEVMPQCISNPC